MGVLARFVLDISECPVLACPTCYPCWQPPLPQTIHDFAFRSMGSSSLRSMIVSNRDVLQPCAWWLTVIHVHVKMMLYNHFGL